jgi:hypothetical protein
MKAETRRTERLPESQELRGEPICFTGYLEASKEVTQQECPWQLPGTAGMSLLS